MSKTYCVKRTHTHGKLKYYRARVDTHTHAACLSHERDNETLRQVTVPVIASRHREAHYETFLTVTHQHCPGHGKES